MLATCQDVGNGEISVFQNEDEEVVSFQYMNASNGGSIMIEKDAGIARQIEFNNHAADIYIAEDSGEHNILTWEIDDVLFCISGNLTENVLIQMAESVEANGIR